LPKVKLDAAFAASAQCRPGKKKTDYWDTITTGFVLEVRSSGGRSYYLRYISASGRQACHLIGRAGDISFDQARKAAKVLRSTVVLGGDPLAAKQQKRAVPTYAAFAEQHIAHAKTYQRSWWSTEGLIRKHLIPRWGRMRLNEIGPQDIGTWLAEKALELKPASVEKLRCLLGKGFQLALEWQVPGVDRNPVRSVPKRAFDNRRQRYLTAEEAARLLEAAGRSANQQLRPILHLLLLTGARLSELLHAQWPHVDLERRSWLIPISKSGKSRQIPLSKTAIEVLEGLPRFKDCPWVTPNPETKRPFVSIKHSFQVARKRAGLRDFRLHDCRHAMASFAIAGGTDIFVLSKLLGHAQVSSTQIYAHCKPDLLMAAAESGAAQLNVTARRD
jgi:integrase